MNLQDIINRKKPPEPWEEGENIPWDEPRFSWEMLQEHLCQDHDLASRRFHIIDKQVEWINSHVLQNKPAKILDLCCGPGLYLERLAKFGHECTGIDYSPASIDYAVEQTTRKGLNIHYLQDDVTSANLGDGYNLIMLIYGELSVFQPQKTKSILKRIQKALSDNGILLIEVHTFETIRKLGQQSSNWYTQKCGLFSDVPHLVLQENFWNNDYRTSTVRYLIIELEEGGVQKYSVTYQAYSDEDYEKLLEECGFKNVRFYPNLTAEDKKDDPDQFFIVAEKYNELAQ